MLTLALGPEAREAGPDLLDHGLLEGDAEVEKRTRRDKRRAILFSIVLQILFVAALALLPLLGKSENIAVRVLVYPHPPYSRPRAPHVPDRQPTPSHSFLIFFNPHCAGDHGMRPPASGASANSRRHRRCANFSPYYGRFRPRRSLGRVHPCSETSEPPRTSRPPRLVRDGGLVQEAKLLNRVEPSYPTFAIPTCSEGRVELHAIIGTDGSIESLEVLSGDSLFVPSARAARL